MCGNTDLWKELRGVLGVSRETDARDQLALHPLLPLFCRGPIISEEWRKMGLPWEGRAGMLSPGCESGRGNAWSA